MHRLRIDVIEDAAGFATLEGEWNALLSDSASDCIFLTYEWLSTWWAHFHRGRRLFVVTLRDGEELVAIAPFVRCGLRATPPRLVPALEFMGCEGVGSEYLDVIVRHGREQAATEALSRVLADRGVMLDLAQLREGDTATTLVKAGLTERRWQAADSIIGPCPYITLGGHTWDSFLATLGSQHRANVRRRLRDIAKTFDMRFEAVTDEADRADALCGLIALHNERWQERGGSMAFHAPAQYAFHEDITRIFLARGWLRLFTLRLGAERGAGLYGFSYHGKFYFYQSGFSTNFGKYSVGLVTMGLAIQSAIAEQVSEFDLLYGFESYKTLWASKSRALVGMELSPRNLPGRIHRASVIARGLVRPARRLVRKALSGQLELARSARA